MLMKLSWHHFKLDCYKLKILTVIPRVITKKVTLKIYKKENEEGNKMVQYKTIKHKRRPYWRN